MENHEEINAFKGMVYCEKCMYWYEAGSSCGCDTTSINFTSQEEKP